MAETSPVEPVEPDEPLEPAALVELIPNVSEGRDREAVESLAEHFTRPDGVWLLDVHSDASHNRSVLTAAARPEAVVAALEALVARAVELIDLRKHRGTHPRVGAVDVIPLVGLRGVTKEQLETLAREVAKSVSAKLDIPTCFYGALATDPSRQTLASLRRGGFEMLEERFRSGLVEQDFGPGRPHASAGLTALGVRDLLIAFNVNLRTDALDVAKGIAKTIRASSGGLPSLQALGFPVEGRSQVQVSMNLTDFRVTSLLGAYRAVATEASRAGVEIAGSEIVGLIPLGASFKGIEEALSLNSPPGVVEERLRARLIST